MNLNTERKQKSRKIKILSPIKSPELSEKKKKFTKKSRALSLILKRR